MTKLFQRSVIFTLTAAILFILVASVTAAPSAEQSSATVGVQILAVNDFHGNLEPPAGSSGRIGTINAGGVEYLARTSTTLRATNPNTLVVSAGDMIGASPLIRPSSTTSRPSKPST